MKVKKHIYALAALMATGVPGAYAQYDQDINVEGKYVPEFISRDRIGVWPSAVRPEVQRSRLEYSLQGVDANFVPHAIPVTVTGWKDTRLWNRNRGYVDFALGSWLESTLSAGYRVIDTPESLFGVRLQYNSISLWKPELAESVSHTRQERYDVRVGVYGSHTMGDVRMEASADYHLGWFDYYGFNPLPDMQVGRGENINAPYQTLNEAAARVDFMSGGEGRLSWRAGAGARYFGMRRLYLPDGSDVMAPASFTGGRETDLALRGGLGWLASSSSTIGADLEGHAIMYGTIKAESGEDASMSAPPAYGLLALTPYYTYRHGNLNLRLGARLDFAMNARTADGERYRTFNAAPDVRVDFATGGVALQLSAGGGNIANTLACNYETDYYATPAIFSSKPVYSPFDGKLALRFGPFSGFYAGISGAYRVTFGQRYFGWYNTVLNQPAPMYARGADYTLRGFSTGLEMGYDAGRYFRIDASGTYQPQSGDEGYFNGMDRPRWTAEAVAVTNPWSTLRFKLGFDFRGVRSFPLLAVETMTGIQEPMQTKIVMRRVPHYVSLNLGVSYDVTKSVGIWVQADNLTNRRNLVAPGLPEPGIRVAAGVGVNF